MHSRKPILSVTVLIALCLSPLLVVGQIAGQDEPFPPSATSPGTILPSIETPGTDSTQLPPDVGTQSTPTRLPLPTPVITPLQAQVTSTSSVQPTPTATVVATATATNTATAVPPTPTASQSAPADAVLGSEVSTPTLATKRQGTDDPSGGLLAPEVTPTPDSQVEKNLNARLDSLSRRVTILSLLMIVLVMLFFVLLFYVAQLRQKISHLKRESTPPRDIVLTPERSPEGVRAQATVPVRDTTPVRDPAPVRDTTIVPASRPSTTGKWTLVGASVIGNDHIKMKKPCQDSHRYELIENDWGIAVVADGAGSAVNSNRGAEFVAKRAAFEIFQSLVLDQGWSKGKRLPTEKEWESQARKCWVKVRDKVIDYAASEGVEPKSLHCTAIVVIFSPQNILVTHIGDGRAAFRDESGMWKAIMKPQKGEEANATYFVTSMRHGSEANFPIESRVINSQVTAFTLMSDGVEKYAFEQSLMNRETTKWIDPNRPYSLFLEPLISSVRKLKEDGASSQDLIAQWEKFLVSGKGVKDEGDDKTLILGLLDNGRG